MKNKVEPKWNVKKKPRYQVEKIERYTGYALEKLKEIANGIGMPLMME